MPELVFDAYSAYYDLLYKNKPYAREAEFVDELIRKHSPDAKTITDVGCGTGIHDWHFATFGYEVMGIDRSASMLSAARRRGGEFGECRVTPTFQQGMLEDFSLPRPCDVVVSLFDVVSYLRSYEAVTAFAKCARAALKSGGLLIFDCWYGPAVYSRKPGTRVRRLANDSIELTRIAESDFNHVHNHIDVHYDIFVRHKIHGAFERIRETHQVRCFFDDELDHLFGCFGFHKLFSSQWFTNAPSSLDSWSILFGYQRQDG